MIVVRLTGPALSARARRAGVWCAGLCLVALSLQACAPDSDDPADTDIRSGEMDASQADAAPEPAARDASVEIEAGADAASGALRDATLVSADADASPTPGAASEAGTAAPDASSSAEAGLSEAGTRGDASTPLAKLTLWIAGDSTVMTYPASSAPQEGWGQELGAFFSPLVTINNQALGGRSTRTFMFGNVTCTNGQPSYTGGTPSETGTRWERIRQNLKPGDYLLIQFGHNDAGSVCERHVALPEFKQNLATMVRVARERSATPILITPMSQLSYMSGMFRATLTDYAAAVKETASAERVELVDLNTLSITFYRSKGYDYVRDQVFLVGETTHFQQQGAVALAQLIAQALRDLPSTLAPYLK